MVTDKGFRKKIGMEGHKGGKRKECSFCFATRNPDWYRITGH